MRLFITILLLFGYVNVKAQYSFKYPYPIFYDYQTLDSCVGHLEADSATVFTFDGTLPPMTGLIQIGNWKIVPQYYILSMECADKTKKTDGMVYFQN